jgi:hypothetical protein
VSIAAIKLIHNQCENIKNRAQVLLVPLEKGNGRPILHFPPNIRADEFFSKAGEFIHTVGEDSGCAESYLRNVIFEQKAKSPEAKDAFAQKRKDLKEEATLGKDWRTLTVIAELDQHLIFYKKSDFLTWGGHPPRGGPPLGGTPPRGDPPINDRPMTDARGTIEFFFAHRKKIRSSPKNI